MDCIGTKTASFSAPAAPEGSLGPSPVFRLRGSQALLDCLSAVEGADSVFLRRLTGLAPGDLDVRLRGLARRGYIMPIPDRSGSLPSLLCLTDRGRDAHATIMRWRFKSSALALLSALSCRRSD